MNISLNLFVLPRFFTVLTLATLLSVSLSTNVIAQNPELVWLKTFDMENLAPRKAYGLFEFKEDSLYVLKFHTNAEESDIGVWGEPGTTPMHQDLFDKMVIYDHHFNPLHLLEFKSYYHNAKPLGFSGDRLYISVLLTVGATNLTHPEITWTHEGGNESQILLEYDMVENTLREIMTTRNVHGGSTYLLNNPFPGFFLKSGLYIQIVEMETGVCHFAQNSESILCSRIFCGELYVNDIPYINPSLQFGNATIIHEISEGITTANPVLPDNDVNAFDFRYFPSQDQDHHYRVGFFRGTSATVNAGGDVLEGYPTDSSFVFYLAKETLSGESQFLTRLFSYNNLGPDTASYNSFASYQDFESLVEMDDNIFLSYQSNFNTNMLQTDTIYVTDCFGNQESHFEMFAHIHPQPILSVRVPYAECHVLKLSESGEPVAELSRTNVDFARPGYISIASSVYLFEVGDNLVWTANYSNLQDTTIALTRRTDQNSSDTTWVDLPSGSGTCFFLLDTELNLTDTWWMAWTDDEMHRGVMIDYVGAYGGDTLLIQGQIQQGTTTSLNPFGDAPEEFYPASKSFLAFYTGVDIVDVKDVRPPTALKIRPNPARDFTTVELGQNSPYTRFEVYDTWGRKITEGILPPEPEFRLPLGAFPSGVYVLRCVGAGHMASAKLVVR